MSVVLVVFGAVLGAALTLVTGLLQDRSRRRWDREQERVKRAESAGESILPLLDEIRNALGEVESTRDDAAEERAYAAADQIEQLALRIPDKAVRERIREIALSAKRYDTLLRWTGQSPSQAGWNLRVCGHNAVGALLGIEHLQEPSLMSEYAAAISDENDIFEVQAESQRMPARETAIDGQEETSTT